MKGERCETGREVRVWWKGFTIASPFFFPLSPFPPPPFLFAHRDFGYVARDPTTRQHRCHVFRCDNPARAVARALLESHQQEKVGGGGGGSMASLATEDSPTKGQAKMVETREEARPDGKERGMTREGEK